MFSYIKWEFKSIFKSSKNWLFIIFGIFMLEFLIVKLGFLDNSLAGIITIAYMIVLMVAALGSFAYGTKRTLDTFSKPTFLLESMIPIPASKLLLSKFLIAIVMNIFYAFVFIFGIFILIAAVENNLVIEMLGDLGKFILEEPVNLLRMFFTMIFSSTAFTSIVTTIFCFLKSSFPNGKGIKIIAGFLGYMAFGLIVSIFGQLLFDMSDTYMDLAIDGFMLILSVVGYLATVYLIENKLEIYN